MNKHIIGTCALIVIFFFSCSVKIDSNNKRYASAKTGLLLREKPETSAKKIAIIPEGEEVLLIEEEFESATIAGMSGKWSKIKWKNKTGWAFGGFLLSEKKASISTNKFKYVKCKGGLPVGPWEGLLKIPDNSTVEYIKKNDDIYSTIKWTKYECVVPTRYLVDDLKTSTDENNLYNGLREKAAKLYGLEIENIVINKVIGRAYHISYWTIIDKPHPPNYVFLEAIWYDTNNGFIEVFKTGMVYWSRTNCHLLYVNEDEYPDIIQTSWDDEGCDDVTVYLGKNNNEFTKINLSNKEFDSCDHRGKLKSMGRCEKTSVDREGDGSYVFDCKENKMIKVKSGK